MSMTKQRQETLCCVAVVVVVIGALFYNRRQTDNEILGVWKVETTQINSFPETETRELWVFQPGLITQVHDYDQFPMELTLSPNKDPKQIRMVVQGPRMIREYGPILDQKGTYELNGNTLFVDVSSPLAPPQLELGFSLGDIRTRTVLTRLDVDNNLSLTEYQDLLVTEFGEAPVYSEEEDIAARDEWIDSFKTALAEFEDQDKKPYVMNPAQEAESSAFILKLMLGTGEEDFENSSKMKIISIIVGMITEIENGGIHQYITNSTGVIVPETFQALKKIGAPDVAQDLETICFMFPGRVPALSQARRFDQLDKFSPQKIQQLNELGGKIYDQKLRLFVLLERFWKSNP